MKYTTIYLVLSFLFFGKAIAQQRRPNVIIIMADDMGYGDPRCYNPLSKIPTPTMDRLASGGMIFWDGHAASSTCTPSRYALITGRYPWRSDLVKSVSWSGYDTPLINANEFTIAKMMKSAGYVTGIVGKWHLGINFAENLGNGYIQPKTYHHSGLQGSRNVDFTIPTFGGPNDLGFDYWFGSAAGHNMEPHVFLENRYTVSIPTIWREAKVPLKPGYSASEVHEGWMAEDWDELDITRTLTENAVDFIERVHQSQQPFFLYFPHIAPHRPSNPSRESVNKSQAGTRGDMVYELDQDIGQIMRTLKKLGIEENTLIFITSDNGGTKTSDNGKDYGHLTSGKLNGYKGSLLEGGHRVPFIAYWPGVIAPNSESNALISNLDFVATLAELTGTQVPENLDSQSFYPILLSPTLSSLRTQFVHSLSKGAFAYRKDQWKYIRYRSASGEWIRQLYDLEKDPYETTNIISTMSKIAERMDQELDIKLYGNTTIY